MDSEELPLSKRDILVNEHLHKLGIASVSDAPEKLLKEAHDIADRLLGEGETN